MFSSSAGLNGFFSLNFFVLLCSGENYANKPSSMCNELFSKAELTCLALEMIFCKIVPLLPSRRFEGLEFKAAM
jgi:hypothetical protein